MDARPCVAFLVSLMSKGKVRFDAFVNSATKRDDPWKLGKKQAALALFTVSL